MAALRILHLLVNLSEEKGIVYTKKLSYLFTYSFACLYNTQVVCPFGALFSITPHLSGEIKIMQKRKQDQEGC